MSATIINYWMLILPPMTIHVAPQTTSHNRPTAGGPTLLPMYIKGIVIRLPLAELLITVKARNAVAVFIARVEIKSCLCEHRRRCVETSRMRPL